MATINLQVELVVDTSNSSTKASILKVTDSGDQDKTENFKTFASKNQLPISTQSEIEAAALKYAKQNQASLP
jgi:hypothetical protein